MVRYFVERCAKGKGTAERLLGSCRALLLIPFVTCYTLWPWLIPFADPAGGIWKNYGYMPAHFILNYIAGRTYLELWTRAVKREHRDRFRTVMWLAPLVLPCVCGLIHVAFGFFGLFPTPFSGITSCIPAAVATQKVAQWSCPNKEVVTRDVRLFAKYLYVVWALWAVELVCLVLWWRSFRNLSAWGQACSAAVMGGQSLADHRRSML